MLLGRLEALGEKLAKTREKRNDLLSEKMRAQLSRCKRVFYEYGNKAMKLLANALRSRRLQSYINQIRSEEETVCQDSVSMSKPFRAYYNKRYNLPQNNLTNNTVAQELLTYLEESDMTHLSLEGAQTMEVPLSLEEFHSRLKLQEWARPWNRMIL